MPWASTCAPWWRQRAARRRHVGHLLEARSRGRRHGRAPRRRMAQFVILLTEPGRDGHQAGGQRVMTFAEHPRRAGPRRRPSLVAVEEMLRWQAPSSTRAASAWPTGRSRPRSAGAVLVLTGGQPAGLRRPRPLRHRRVGPPDAFGHGIHYCIGHLPGSRPHRLTAVARPPGRLDGIRYVHANWPPSSGPADMAPATGPPPLATAATSGPGDLAVAGLAALEDGLVDEAEAVQPAGGSWPPWVLSGSSPSRAMRWPPSTNGPTPPPRRSRAPPARTWTGS